MKQQRSIHKVFAVPLFLFIVGMVGLVSALLYDGIFDLIASVAVGLPVFIVFSAVFKQARYNKVKHKHTHR